jgi:hypothetical protein
MREQLNSDVTIIATISKMIILSIQWQIKNLLADFWQTMYVIFYENQFDWHFIYRRFMS